MAQFITTLDNEPTDPPNAALITRDPDSEDATDTLLIELVNPQFDAANATLTYTATILTDYQQGALVSAAIDQQDFDFPASFGQGGLFIDSFCGETRVACYHRNSHEFVDITPGLYGLCYDSLHDECHTCTHERRICAAKFPDPCAPHANGWWPCYGEWAN